LYSRPTPFSYNWGWGNFFVEVELLDIVKLMDDKELCLVGSPLFNSISEEFSNNFSIVFSWMLVCDDPHMMFYCWSRPELRKVNGVVSLFIIEIGSWSERGVLSGIYILHIVIVVSRKIWISITSKVELTYIFLLLNS